MILNLPFKEILVGPQRVSEEPGPRIETCGVVLHTFISVIVCHTESGKDFIRCLVLIRLLDSC